MPKKLFRQRQTTFLAFQYKSRRVANRVTRLGDFSPNGSWFTLGSLLKITEVAHLLLIHFSYVGTDGVLIYTKIVWATFWAIFSKTLI
jgi:hypothetical protein